MSSDPPMIDLGALLGAGASGSVRRGTLRAAWGEWPRGTAVAVKVLDPDEAGNAGDAGDAAPGPDGGDPGSSARTAAMLEAEWLSSQAARHPALVRVLWAGPTEQGPTIVMEFVEGAELAARDVLEEDPLRAVGARVAGALAALHAAGWSHGDVKPGNLRLDGERRAVLVDLGFASFEGATGSGRPSAGSAGTPLYLAPERSTGGPPSPAADVYALGVTLYQLATGVHPILGDVTRGESPTDEFFAAIDRARADPPSHMIARLSPLCDHLLLAMLERRPGRRPTAAEVEACLTHGEQGLWWSRVRRAGNVRALAARSDMPFVGHAHALERLHTNLERLQRLRTGRTIVVEGARGSGRSRVVTEFAARARLGDDPPLFLFARCDQNRSAQPAAALCQLLEQDLGRAPGRPLGPAERERLSTWLPPNAAEQLAHALEPGEGPLPSSAEIANALAAWLRTLGRERACILFLDDVNQAGRATLEALRRAASELAAARVLVVLGRRTDEPVRNAPELEELQTELGRANPIEYIAIEPLSRDDVRELVELAFHPRAPRLRIAETLWSRSLGVPALVSEIVRTLVDRNQAHPASEADPRLVLSIPPDAIPRPRSLSEIIAERYALLPASDRLWLRRLAVVGGRIEPAFLARAFPGSRASHDELLARLVHSGWLVPDGALLRFARPALREAVYRMLPPQTRAHLHRAAARAFEPDPGAELDLANAFQRCFHWRAAGYWHELLAASEELITRLGDRGHPRRRLKLAAWGLEALEALGQVPLDRGEAQAGPDVTARRSALLEAAADAADRVGERELEERYLAELAELAVDPGANPAQTARIYLLHGRYAVGTGLYGPARAMLKNAVDFADVSADRALASEARRRLAAIEAEIGHLERARTLAREALELADHPLQAAVSHILLGQIEVVDDNLERALTAVDDALALWRRASAGTLPGIAAAAHMLRGRTYRVAGRPRRAQAALKHALRLSQSASERRLAVEAQARLGALEFESGALDEAETRLRDALLAADEIRDRRGAALARLWLGVLLAARSDRETRQQLDASVAAAAELGLRRVEALGRAVSARAALAVDDLERAQREIRRALDLLHTSGAELGDRLVIEATAVRVEEARLERDEPARGRDRARRPALRQARRDLERLLARKVRATAGREARERRRAAGERLLAAALGPEVSPYPRLVRT